MGHRRQKGKGSKRLKSWHRGRGEARRWRTVARRLPELGTGADPTAGEPVPYPRGPSRMHGDTA
jgi:hypothetical protein